MVKRILLFGVLGSVLQLIFYCVTTFAVWNLIAVFHKFRGDWSSFIAYSVFLFGFLLLFQNILVELVNKKVNVIFLFLLIVIIYIVGWGEDYKGWPTKTILILTTGLTALSLKLIFDLNYKNLKSSIVNQKS